MITAKPVSLVFFAALVSQVGSQIVRFEQCLPCHCHRGPYPGLNITANIADCSKRILLHIPTHLPTDIDVLILSDNPLTSITAELSVYSNLKAFVMHGCEFITLQDHTFMGLLNLKILDLHSQRVGIRTWSKNALAGLPNLEVLNISVEPVYPSSKTFAKAAKNLLSLKELNVHFISNITEHFFMGVEFERLYMTIDKAMYLPATLFDHLSPQSKLKSLHIHSKSLRAIPEQLLSNVLGSLEVFHLTVKYIPRLPEKLLHLDMGNISDPDSPIDMGDISDPDSPKVESNLTEVWLIGVSSIPPHLFKDLGSLRRLVIRQFNDISDDAFSGLAMLRELTLTDSPSFRNVSKYLFRTLYELTDLKISNTQIAELKEEQMEMNSELIYLDLSDNQLSRIESYTFWFMTNMRQLDLSRNRFKTFEQQVLEVGSLLTLDLSFNHLEELEEDMFGDLYILSELKLRGNQLSSLPRGIFGFLSSVRWIDLSLNNFMRFSASYIEELDELTMLDLSDNCIQHFDVTTFNEDHPNAKVNLDRNPLTGEDTCKKQNHDVIDKNKTKNAVPVKLLNMNRNVHSSIDANTTEPAVAVTSSQPRTTENKEKQERQEKAIHKEQTTNVTKQAVVNDTQNGQPMQKLVNATILNSNCSSLNLTGDTNNATSAANCSLSNAQPVTNDTDHLSRVYVTVIILSTVVTIGVVVCVVLAVVIGVKRRSSYARVRTEQEASTEECAHCVGAGGEGSGRPHPLRPCDDILMEHTSFV